MSTTVVEVRPPRAPLRFIGVVAAGAVPMAVAAAALGDVLLGLVALVSAAWAGSLTYVGWTARAVADAEGVEVHWMRSTETAAWADVVTVEVDRAGPGGPRRGAVLDLRDGRRIRWAPWIPFLWFAHRSVVESLLALDDLLVERGGSLRVVDPDAPDDDAPTWTRTRPERRLPRHVDEN